MAQGVDVSRHQGSIDWRAAQASGIAWAYVKLTEGIGYVDPAADSHLDGARAAGLVVGAYHFARPDTNSPEADGEHFGTELRARGLAQPGTLPPCLDMERTAQVDYIDWSEKFIATVRAITGYQPMMVYASSSWWKNRYNNGLWLDEKTWAWVAHYGRAPGDQSFRAERVVAHQYTDTGRIPGYDSNIDLNAAFVDLSSLTCGLVSEPAPTEETYAVQSGDTLARIALSLNIPGGWRALYEANRETIGEDPARIQVGQRYRIPR